LVTAKTHPPAVVHRQQEADRALLLPLVAGFSERQARLSLMFAAVIGRHKSETFQTLTDDDIAQAAEALAATIETAGRGIVYERRAATLSAERLLSELKTLHEEITKQGGSTLDRDLAIALRRIEQTAREMGKDPPATRFHELLSRSLGGNAPDSQAEKGTGTVPASSLILP